MSAAAIIRTDVDTAEEIRAAAELVVACQFGSVSMVQRKFSFGYVKATRIMERLVELGVISPGVGSRAHDVLVDVDALDAHLAPRTTLYIAGPMTGYPSFNYPAFHAAEQRLRAARYDVLNPAHTESENTTGKPQEWGWYMRRALALLVQADGVALLPGSLDSRGARLEMNIARQLGMATKDVDAWLAAEVVTP